LNIGRFSATTVNAIMINVPERIPAQPTPAIARPIISTVEEGAAPQMAEPISKIAIALRYTHLMER
jgi:hypothetical protein